MDKLATLWREVMFGWKAANSWADQYALLYHTARFHIHNWLNRSNDNRTSFTVDLRIDDSGAPIRLTLRPFSGDLFVLYEVLAAHAYRIGPKLLSPQTLRTIVDCGANIGITSLFSPLGIRLPPS
jgi:hypothetical protein